MTRKQFKAWGIGLVVLLTLIIVLQNTDVVSTRILFVQVEMPRAMLLFVNLAIGFLVGLIAGGRLRRENKKQPTT